VAHASGEAVLPPGDFNLIRMKNSRSGTRRRVQRLFDCWGAFAACVRDARRVLLLLDFDGTLVGFKKKPEEVELDPATRRLLARLARHPRLTLGFVSGRRRADLSRRVGVRGARYYGLHGWESRSGMRLKAATRRQLVEARRQLAAKIEGLPEVWLEDKKASLVLHYREAPQAAARQAQAAARAVLRAFAPHLRGLPGKKIWELLPAGLPDKGAAVVRLANGHGSGDLAIYAGDDTTDEPAFAALEHGVTIHVGNNSKTQARYRVHDPREMILFLERLADLLS